MVEVGRPFSVKLCFKDCILQGRGVQAAAQEGVAAPAYPTPAVICTAALPIAKCSDGEGDAIGACGRSDPVTLAVEGVGRKYGAESRRSKLVRHSNLVRRGKLVRRGADAWRGVAFRFAEGGPVYFGAVDEQSAKRLGHLLAVVVVLAQGTEPHARGGKVAAALGNRDQHRLRADLYKGLHAAGAGTPLAGRAAAQRVEDAPKLHWLAQVTPPVSCIGLADRLARGA